LVPSYGHTTKFTHCRLPGTVIMRSLPLVEKLIAVRLQQAFPA